MKRLSQKETNSFIVKASYVFEVILGIILVLSIIISVVPILYDVAEDYVSLGTSISFSIILEKIFNLVIGIEFLKMLCQHDMDSVIEVLLFTLARKLVVEHGTTAVSNLLVVIAIAVLFAIRKYFFVDRLNDRGKK